MYHHPHRAMFRLFGSLTIGIGLTPAIVEAQTCAPSATTYFEFQVETPAAFIPDSAVSPRPSPPQRRRQPTPATLVSFVVDTLGEPEPNTFKIIRTDSHDFAMEAKASLPKWRYRPAQIGGCRVRQLVQTGVER
jgi:hypothetical protein